MPSKNNPITKHIPVNSITIIAKFNTESQMVECLEDPEFQETFGKLSGYLMKKKCKVEYFSNP